MKTPQEYVAGLYCRISSDDGFTDKESNSITTQKQILARYCSDHGYRIGEYYCDDGYTGTNFDRPDFKRMLSDIEAGRINMVITKDLSRLGRNHILTGQYTDIIFARYGVRYIAISDDVDTFYGENDIAPFKNILNEMYARDISKKQKASASNRQKNGLFCGNTPPYGYLKDPEQLHHLIIDEKVAWVVRHMFDLALQGFGARAIATQLQREQIPRPCIRYSESGIPNVKPAKDIYAWPQPTVTKMLKDRVYTGAIVGNKRPTVSFQLKKRVRSKEEDLVIVEGMHEPIIDIDTFEKVQKILKTRHKDSPKEAGGLLNGYLKCSDCGKTMTRSTWKNHKPNEHYSCRTYRNYGKAFCTHHYIQAQVAEELILRDIREKARAALADDGEIFREMCQRSKGALNADREKLTKQIAQCRTRLIEIDTVVGKMYEDKILGKIPEHRFEMMTEKYDKESAELQAKIDEAEQALKAGTEQEVNTEIFRGIISKYVNISELTLEVLADTIEKIVVGEREKVDGTWRQRFDIYYRFVGLI